MGQVFGLNLPVAYEIGPSLTPSRPRCTHNEMLQSIAFALDIRRLSYRDLQILQASLSSW